MITCQTFDHVSNSKWSLVKLGPEHVTLDGVENTCAERRLRARRGFATAVRASQAYPAVPSCREKGAAAD